MLSSPSFPRASAQSEPLPPRVLVVEDEAKTRASLQEGLQLEQWSVFAASSAEDAQAILDRESAFDLAIVDWMLPDRDGLSFVGELRARGLHLPVLMLTARATLDDRVAGLENGADDYLPKPFAFAELVARCRALLRRPVLSTDQFLRCEDLQLDTRARTARRGQSEIALSPREVDLLEYLLRYQGQVVTREMLERDVWQQTRRFTSLDNVIDVQMMRLRKKVDGERPDKLIQTLRGIGYRLAREIA
jgi:two-component system copper resistance phosphate regulon response regulator CusR